MKLALQQGRFGRLLRADAVMKWYRSTDYYRSDAWRSDRRSGAGVTIQHAFHYIDLLQYLAGPAESVDARMTNLGHPDIKIEDTLDATIRFQNGAIGSVAASTALWPGTDVRIDFSAKRGGRHAGHGAWRCGSSRTSGRRTRPSAAAATLRWPPLPVRPRPCRASTIRW